MSSRSSEHIGDEETRLLGDFVERMRNLGAVSVEMGDMQVVFPNEPAQAEPAFDAQEFVAAQMQAQEDDDPDEMLLASSD